MGQWAWQFPAVFSCPQASPELSDGMSKKRASVSSEASQRTGSKWEPAYWRRRLFKNTYTHKHRRFRTRNWCVKIQHSGERRTLSLRSGKVAQAAAEACDLY